MTAEVLSFCASTLSTNPRTEISVYTHASDLFLLVHFVKRCFFFVVDAYFINNCGFHIVKKYCKFFPCSFMNIYEYHLPTRIFIKPFLTAYFIREK